jgi:hypothetical protein
MRHLLYTAALVASATPLAAQNTAPAVPPAVLKAAETITKEDVARRVGIIADDSMLGRDTPSPGLEKTAQYIADQFKRFGLQPGGDNGTWFQRYPLPGDAAATAPNTVGILEGSDPKLKDEYIVVSAHMDHVGIGGGADSINNGADDDGSGTTGVVELAEAFSQPGARPKRSLIFLTVSGEEKGLWGSAHFAAHPPVPIQQIVADLNLDMIGRNWKDTVVAIGKEHSDLGATLNRVNAAHPELGMTAIDDIWPEEQFYFRSDHYNFASRGVPILFFFTGVHEDYHQPSDTPDKIDAEKEARILRLVYYLGQELANAPDRPKWNEESYKQIVKQQGAGRGMTMGQSSGPKMGVQLEPLSPRDTTGLGLSTAQGLVVTSVVPGSGAEAGGIVKGDVIISIDGKPTPSINELKKQIGSWKAGTPLKVEVARKGGVRQQLDVTPK